MTNYCNIEHNALKVFDICLYQAGQGWIIEVSGDSTLAEEQEHEDH